jgi:hypothetical protein
VNTIRKPRKRPRKNSVNFDTFWWLLAHEAAYRVLFNHVKPGGFERDARASLCSVPTDALRVRVRYRLNWRPDRRNAL